MGGIKEKKKAPWLTSLAAAFVLCAGLLALGGCTQQEEAPEAGGSTQSEQPGQSEARTFTDSAGRTVERAKAFITDHYGDSELSVETLCGHLHLSPCLLYTSPSPRD